MVASASVIYNASDGTPQKLAVQVINGDIVYAGAYSAMGGYTHGTTATRGRGLPWAANVAGLIPMGFTDQRVAGDTSATPIPEESISAAGRVIRNLTVTDSAATVADNGLLVYGTDDNTFTLTRPTTIAFPVGITTRFVAVDTFDVYFFSFETMVAIALGGAGRETWCLGSFVPEWTGAGNVLTGIVAPHHGIIAAVYAICASAPADADVHGSINLEIGGTDVTGGVIAIDFADTLGLKIAGTAITAANVMHEGDLIDVEVAAAGLVAGTVGDGLYNLYATVIRLPGT